MMRKTGRLIHACPAQIAALAESFFITGALETQMSNDVSRGVGWPARYRTSPNDRTWPSDDLNLGRLQAKVTSACTFIEGDPDEAVVIDF